MKKITKNKSANFYLNAAAKFGIQYKILNEKKGRARIFDEKRTLNIKTNALLGINPRVGAKRSKNKVKTSSLLREENIPVPVFKAFRSFEKAVNYAQNELANERLIVVKPTNSSLSAGITVNPSSKKQIKKAIKEAFGKNSTIMIERYISGKHFRITIFDNEIIAITERMASNVTGNGKNTLLDLIKRKNTMRKKMNLPSILLRLKDMDYLKNQKIDLEKIYPKGVNVILQLGCDLDIGGERVKVDIKSVPQINLDLFICAVKKLGLRFGGIDYITPDITTPYTQITTAINEINSAPDSGVHYRDTHPGNNYAAERIVNKIFSKKIKISENLAIKTFSKPESQQIISSL